MTAPPRDAAYQLEMVRAAFTQDELEKIRRRVMAEHKNDTGGGNVRSIAYQLALIRAGYDAAPAPPVAQPAPSRQPLDSHMVMGSIPAPLLPAEPPATDDLTDERIMSLMRTHLFPSQIRALTTTLWKDGIDIEVPFAGLRTLLTAVIERQAREIADYKVELSRLQSERDEARELFNKEYNEARESRRRLRDELSGERDRHKRTQERAERAEAKVAVADRIIGFADMVRNATHPGPASWSYYDRERAGWKP